MGWRKYFLSNGLIFSMFSFRVIGKAWLRRKEFRVSGSKDKILESKRKEGGKNRNGKILSSSLLFLCNVLISSSVISPLSSFVEYFFSLSLYLYFSRSTIFLFSNKYTCMETRPFADWKRTPCACTGSTYIVDTPCLEHVSTTTPNAKYEVFLADGVRERLLRRCLSNLFPLFTVNRVSVRYVIRQFQRLFVLWLVPLNHLFCLPSLVIFIIFKRSDSFFDLKWNNYLVGSFDFSKAGFF